MAICRCNWSGWRLFRLLQSSVPGNVCQKRCCGQYADIYHGSTKVDAVRYHAHSQHGSSSNPRRCRLRAATSEGDG